MFRHVFTVIAFLTFAFLYNNHYLPAAILIFYILASLFTFVIYCFDKSAARNKRWRVKETQLHFAALLGGWFGALLAQGIVKHKIKKSSFMRFFYLTVIFNSLVLFCLLNSGTIYLKIVEQLSFLGH